MKSNCGRILLCYFYHFYYYVGPHDENGNDQGDESGSRETKEVVDEQISSQAAESVSCHLINKNNL